MILSLVLAAGCAGCHPAQAQQLEASRHASAFRLQIFQLAVTHTSTRWCASCHQPEGRAAPGLTCESCHRVPGQPEAVLSSGVGSAEAKRAHVVVEKVDFATSSCAKCHQFNAPKPGHLDPIEISDQPLQNTVSEAGGRTCSGCHEVHGPTGGHDRATLASALRIDARASSDTLRLTLTASAGHRFPTGDMFRRLVLNVCADAACRSVLDSRELTRTFDRVGDSFVLRADSSLADGETRTVELPVGPFWEARYFFGDPRFEPWLPTEEVSTLVAHGQL